MLWSSIGAADLCRVLFKEPQQQGAIIEKNARKNRFISAAVLFPIIQRQNSLSVLFTKRTDSLKDHPGQISFPGGRVEPEDRSLSETALREANEEISLAESAVETLGYLPTYKTITGYAITPVIGLITPPVELAPDPNEVAEIFEVPLSFLIDPANHQQHVIDYKGEQRSYYAIPYHGYFIWGATAGIIVSLSERLAMQTYHR